MSKMIAYCGLVCSDCPAFLATQSDDDAAREETAAFFSKNYGLALKPEDINCDGCLTDGGRLIEHCQTCGIRKCCREKGLDNCAHCDDQPCDSLKKFHEYVPVARENLDTLVKRS